MKYRLNPHLILVFVFCLSINLTAQDLRFGLSFDIGLGNKIQDLDNMEFVWLDETYVGNPGEEDFFLKFAGTANLEYLHGRSAYMLEAGFGEYNKNWKYYNTVFEVDTAVLRINKSMFPVYLKYGYLFGKNTFIQPFVGVGMVNQFNYTSSAEITYPAELALGYNKDDLIARLPEDISGNPTEFVLVTGVEFILPSALKLGLNYEYKAFSALGSSYKHIFTIKISRTVSLLNREKRNMIKYLKYIKYEE